MLLARVAASAAGCVVAVSRRATRRRFQKTRQVGVLAESRQQAVGEERTGRRRGRFRRQTRWNDGRIVVAAAAAAAVAAAGLPRRQVERVVRIFALSRGPCG